MRSHHSFSFHMTLTDEKMNIINKFVKSEETFNKKNRSNTNNNNKKRKSGKFILARIYLTED